MGHIISKKLELQIKSDEILNKLFEAYKSTQRYKTMYNKDFSGIVPNFKLVMDVYPHDECSYIVGEHIENNDIEMEKRLMDSIAIELDSLKSVIDYMQWFNCKTMIETIDDYITMNNAIGS